MLAFISLQDLKGSLYFGGSYDKLKWVKEIQWDMLVIDEAHEGVDTFKTDLAFEQITRRFTLHLSGTPFKALAKGHFAENEIYNWSYADEQTAKANWQNAELDNPYENLPKLNMFSYQMSRMISEQVNQGAEIDGQDHDFAFDLNEFFATDDKGGFKHKKEVEKWLDTLSRNEKYPFSTPELRQELKHTFWLLDRVASAKALLKLLKNHPVFEHYEIVLAAGDGKIDDESENSKSLDKVRQAVKSGKKTITLSVGQLTTGITVPQWTAVLMLSNLKSAALYMQAAFRAQNPWSYSDNGQHYRKENAYLFDFAPERTLMIYDAFANNLFSRTAGNNGTSQERTENIRQLLNFFPVIAEDSEGKMRELNAEQVLTIPQTIKAAEVVRRGFLSNLLFQNISHIFGATSDEARAILEQLPKADENKVIQGGEIDTQEIEVDEDGEVIIDNEWVITTTDAHFGAKIYQNLGKTAEENAGDLQALQEKVADAFKTEIESGIHTLATENQVTQKAAEKIIQRSANELAESVAKVAAQAEIQRNEAKAAYDQAVKNAENTDKVAELAAQYQATTEKIEQDFAQTVAETVQQKSQELTQSATHSVLTQAEEQKKTTVEEDVKARLRGFARTIPSFLMAYGTNETTLANFDTQIEDVVFKEVTGISLEQFRILRDKYAFFDEAVFNQSVQEFMHKRQTLADYFDESQTEDIFSYIPPQKTNQIFTPRKVVHMMLDKLESEEPQIFSDPHRTFADLYVKSGLFLTEIIKRLYKGLEGKIPDKKARLQHILTNQIYGFAPSKIIHRIAENFIFGFDNEGQKISRHHLICLDTLPFAKETSDQDFEEICKEKLGKERMKFDVIVGNPPYQEENVGENNQSVPIYHHFYDLAEKFSEKYCLISPARFLSNQGATPKNWNNKMLKDKHLNVKFFNVKSNEVFPNTDIKGGIVVLYRDQEKDFGEIDTFIPFEELRNIFHKVKLISKDNISHFVYSPDSYRFTDILFEENPELIGRTDKSHAKAVASSVFTRYPEVFSYTKPNDNDDYIQIYGRLNGERTYAWIKRKYIAPHENLDKWKIFVPGANGTGAIGETLSTPVIGQPVIGQPVIGHNQTFVSLGKFNIEFEAQALLKYIKSKFGRTMLGIMKTTQNNQSKNTWSKVPMQDFTANSDIDWTKSIAEIDRQLYKKYGLDKQEIEFIESKVREME